MFEYLYDKIVSIYHDKEPLINVIAWYGLETVNRTGGDEINSGTVLFSCVLNIGRNVIMPKGKRLVDKPGYCGDVWRIPHCKRRRFG